MKMFVTRLIIAKPCTHTHKLIKNHYVVKAYPCYYKSTEPLPLAAEDKIQQKKKKIAAKDNNKSKSHLTNELKSKSTRMV